MNNLLAMTTATADSVSAGAQNTAAFDFTAVFLIISIIISLAVPVTIMLLGKSKFKGSFKMFFEGIIGFIVFYVFLPSLISTIVMPNYSSQTGSYVEAIIYLAIRIVCLEAGRFLFVFLRRKKANTWGDGMLLGAGYCFVDTFIILVGFLVPFLILEIVPDMNKIDGVWRELLIFVQPIAAEDAWRTLTYGMTSVAFGAVHLFSSVTIYLAVTKNEKWLCIFAILADALVLVPNKLASFDVWIFKNDYVVIPYLLVIAVVIYLFVYVLYNKIYNRKEESIDTSYFEKLTAKEDNEKKINEKNKTKK